MHFSKNSGRLPSATPEILAYVSDCSANVQPILNSYIPNLKLKYEDSDNIKADQVNTVISNLRRAFFGTSGTSFSQPKNSIAGLQQKTHICMFPCFVYNLNLSEGIDDIAKRGYNLGIFYSDSLARPNI